MSAQNSVAAIECNELRRVYESRTFLGAKRETVAVADVSFTVSQGSVFGLLGPNGAGKTTTVRVLATLLTATSGVARVLGFDVTRQPPEVRKRMGLVLGGERGLYYRLTGRENLRYFGALNLLDPAEISRRSDELLTRVGLADAADRLVNDYSRGMKQRLHLARGLLTDPDVLFLDEPTIGLDPIAAREVREIVPALARRGKTVLLTTHYMFEADQLCDTIALIDKGRIVAKGTPTEIKRGFSKTAVIEVTIRNPEDGLAERVAGIPGVLRTDTVVDEGRQKLLVQVRPDDDRRDQIVEVIGADNVEAILVRDPTLEEAYIAILGTGHSL